MTGWSAVRLIAAREITQRLRSRIFQVITLVVSALLVVGVLLPALFGDDEAEPEPLRLGVVGEPDAGTLAALYVVGFQRGVEPDIEVLEDRAAAEAALLSAEAPLDAVVVPGEAIVVGSLDPITSGGVLGALQESLRLTAALADSDRTVEELVADLTTPPLPIEELVGDSTERLGRFLLANIGAGFVYATLLMYGSWIVSGIIEEKGSRVVEILLSKVRARDLLVGKLLGIGAVGLLQTLVIFGPAVGAGIALNSEVIPAGAGLQLANIALWWVLGFAFYATLMAGAGSLVSRPEEAQVVLTPVTVILVVAFAFSFGIMNEPDGLAATVGGILPFSAPIVMIVRGALGQPTVVDYVLAVTATLIAAFGSALLAARIYRGGILRVGSRVRLADAWRGGGR